MDINAIINNAAKSKQDSKKNKVPVVITADPKIISGIVSYCQGKKKELEGKSDMDRAKSKIQLNLEKIRKDHCINEKKHHGSIKITSESGDVEITFVTVNKYSEIQRQYEARLREIFGDQYNDLFKVNTTIQLSESAKNDDNLMSKIIELVGVENFAKFFDVKQSIEPTEKFHNSKDIDTDIGNKAEVAINEGLIKQYSPSLKI